jgi:hypothetical protein
MTKREARRLALLIIHAEIDGSLCTSDEWCRHPEDDREFTRAEMERVKDSAQAWLANFTKRLPGAQA